MLVLFLGRDIAQSVNFLEDRQSEAGRYNVRKKWKKSLIKLCFDLQQLLSCLKIANEILEAF